MKRFVPVWRHIATCIPCGWREATTQGNAYAERCAYCGGPMEHWDAMIDTPDELGALPAEPRQTRLAAMAGDYR